MTNSESRQQSLIIPLFNSNVEFESTHLILSSGSDIGVRRNFGRPGARFAPQAIINVLKKFNNHMEANTKISLVDVASPELEKTNFQVGQEFSHKIISDNLSKFRGQKVLHIGGGHDHISPLLSAIDEQGFNKILVINVDAHCDTRISDEPNSGTPFRDFSNKAKTPWTLYQYGIHDFANSKSTLTPLKNNNMIIVDQNYCSNKSPSLDFINESIDDKTAVIFSLDVDGLTASIFEGVSAVNHKGLELEHVEVLLTSLVQAAGNAKIFFGIYEFNPIYENLSQKGARGLAYLIHKFWEK